MSRNKKEGLYVGVNKGKHTRAKILSAVHGISLIFVRKPAAPTAFAVRMYRNGVWK